MVVLGQKTSLSVGCGHGNAIVGTQNAALSAGGRNGSNQEQVCY